MPAGGGWEVEAGSSRVLERTPLGTACISPRGRDGAHKNIERGKLGYGVERGVGDRHCERSMHTSLTMPIFVLDRVGPWVGFKDI